MQQRKEVFLYSTFILIAVFALIAIALGFFTDLPFLLFGKYNADGSKVLDNSNKGEFLKVIGAFLGGTLVIIGLWINNLRVAEQTRQNTIAEKSQINTRFKDAAILLSSNENSSILSGIFSLHQIAVETSKDPMLKGYVKTINKILCFFLREKLAYPKSKMKKEIEIEYEHKLTFQHDPPPDQYNISPIIIHSIFEVLFKPQESIYKDEFKDLSFCVFVNIEFTEYDIRNTSFEGCFFRNVTFKNTQFLKTKFNSSTLDEIQFKNDNFFYCELVKTQIKNSLFSECELENCIFEDSTIEHLDFDSCTIVGSFFNITKQSNSNYNNCKIEQVLFNGSTLDEVEFACSKIKNKSNNSKQYMAQITSFQRVDFKDISFYQCSIESDVNFNDTKLKNYSIEEIIKNAQQLTSTDR